MARIASTIVQFGLAVRGIYGEGTEAKGHFYQISNQVSIGATEEDILAKITGVAKQIAEQELHARENIKKEILPVITDKVWRAFGILKNAYMISTAEALELLSMTRLGAGLGILPCIPMKLLNELVIMIKPGCLQKLLGDDPSAAGRDIKRASLIREKLSLYNSSQI